MEVRKNSFKAWLLAARPKTLTGAATPVIIGGAFAASNVISFENFAWLPFVLCLLFALLMQIAANFVNDWYDFKKGSDTEERLGPKRACAQGWIAPDAMRAATIIMMSCASLIGFPLILYGGYNMLWVGGLCLLFCVLYTTFFSYLGLGDLLVLLFFGLIPVSVTYYILTGTVTFTVVCASLATGSVVDCLLVVNNFRDRDTDCRAGKKTIVVRIGERASLFLYLICGLSGVLLLFPAALDTSVWLFAVMIPYLLLHIQTWCEMKRIYCGRELNKILALTSRNILVYGLSLSVGLILSMYL